MERLIAAAAEEAEERPYGEISVRTIAKRAGVAPATAYTYFSGKDHLLAEVLLQRVQVSPQPGRPHAVRSPTGWPTPPAPWASAPWGRRPSPSARQRCWGRPRREACALAAGCRDQRAGWRPRSVPGVDPAVLNVLQVTYTGALLSAGMGHLAFDAVPPLMGEATALMTGRGGSETPAS